MSGIQLDIEGQVRLLQTFAYRNELLEIPVERCDSGIGGGYSTLLARRALAKNSDGAEHICIEPFEQPWLSNIGLTQLIRSRVECVPLGLFRSLGSNDILFIDSSHVLRTGGDVWYEYLRILPTLNPGVLVHAHDIFLPFPYPRDWLLTERRYWTEQYLLQALLQDNSRFKVLLALHLLSKERPDELARACPIYAQQPGRDPGSFWMTRY